MNRVIAKLLVLIGANTKELTDALAATERRLRKAGAGMQTAGRAMTRALSVPLGLVGGLAGKLAGEFEKSMTTSTAIMGELSDTMRTELADTARAVSKEVTYSAQELGKAYFYLASAGLDAQQSLKALPLVAKFATAGQFDLARATDLVTDAQSALGLTVKDASANLKNMTRVSDALVKANTLANASVEQFSSALTNKAGAALKNLGKDLEEGLAVLAAYADQGVKAEEAGTQLSIVMRELQRASLANADAWRDYKVKVYDSREEMRHLADILADIERAMEGASDKQKRLTLQTLGFNDKSIQATLALIGYSRRIREWDEELRDAGGTTEKVAQKQLANLIDKLAILRNVMVDAGISLGNALMPAFEAFLGLAEKVGDTLRGLAGWMEKLPRSLRVVGASLGVILAALGPLMWVLGTLLTSLAAIVRWMKSLGAVLVWVQAHPLALAIVAFTTLVVTLGAYHDATRTSATETRKLADELDEMRAAAGRAREEMNRLATEEAAKEAEILEKARKRRQLVEEMRELQKRRAAGEWGLELLPTGDIGAQIKQIEEDIGRLDEELSKLRAAKWAAQAAFRTRELAVATEEYRRAMEDATTKASLQNNELAYQSDLLALQEQHLDRLIALKGDRGEIDALYKEVQARRAVVAELEKEREEYDAATTSQLQFAEAMAFAERKYQVTGDRLEFLNNAISTHRKRLDELIAAGANYQELEPFLVKLQEMEREAEALAEVMGRLTPDEQARQQFDDWTESLKLTMGDLYRGIQQVGSGLTSGLGGAFAQAAVYGQEFGEAMGEMLKSVGAAAIAMVVDLATQQLLYLALVALGIAEAASTKIAGEIAYGAVAAAASALAAAPFPANFALAAGAGAAATAMLSGIAATAMTAAKGLGGGLVALAEGGIATHPTLAVVGERGTEVVFPLRELERFVGGGGQSTVVLELDGREFARAVVPWIPGVVRRRIGR